MIYKWKETRRGHHGLDAQVVGERLQHLRGELGDGFSSRAVVDDARPETAPLHPAFTWDDGEAAERWRQQEARGLVQSIVVVVNEGTAEQAESRAFVTVIEKETGEDRYVPTVEAVNDDEYRLQIIDRALAEAIRWRERYDDIREFARIHSAIDKVAEQRDRQKLPKAA